MIEKPRKISDARLVAGGFNEFVALDWIRDATSVSGALAVWDQGLFAEAAIEQLGRRPSAAGARVKDRHADATEPHARRPGATVTTPPTPQTRPIARDVVWTRLEPVVPRGVRRPPRVVEPAYVLGLRMTWALPGRSRRTPATARAHVREICRIWRVRKAADALQLIVSELVTNAVLHASGETVTLALIYDGERVWVFVTDEGSRRPVRPQHAALDAESGRGLDIVGQFAEACGVIPDERGTRVWACVTVPPRQTTGG
ncbi:ATP-binding protein [Streptomyces monashensis]|uniref:ATP-binding protein n=1 Tax=Streptomyces monashensis TaxID=1678012 RepID=UPI0033CC8DA3